MQTFFFWNPKSMKTTNSFQPKLQRSNFFLSLYFCYFLCLSFSTSLAWTREAVKLFLDSSKSSLTFLQTPSFKQILKWNSDPISPCHDFQLTYSEILLQIRILIILFFMEMIHRFRFPFFKKSKYSRIHRLSNIANPAVSFFPPQRDSLSFVFCQLKVYRRRFSCSSSWTKSSRQDCH